MSQPESAAFARRVARFCVLFALPFVPACGGADLEASSDGSPVSDGPSDATPRDGAPGDSSQDAGSPFGLEMRPPNATCHPPTSPQPPTLLSQTGCVNPQNPAAPAGGLIPYDVNSPLWSDGALKQRFLAVPDGARIHIGTDGDWDLPNGTVLVKMFSLGQTHVETRLLVRTSTGQWNGYSYAWNTQQTDATLLAADTTRTFATGTWTYPVQECLGCHNASVGGSIGLETGQLNRAFAYPSGITANQLATFDHIGLFDAPLALPPEALPAYPMPSNPSIAVGPRARSYLHANCSMCHRPPAGPFGGSPDFQFATAFSGMGICNVAPLAGGPAGSMRLFPGQPTRSVISLRMHSTDPSFRMPIIGSKIVDSAGTAVIDAWITSLTSCAGN